MKWIFVPTTDDSDYKSHDTMSKLDPATYSFKELEQKTEVFHTELQGDFGGDIRHFAPIDGEMEVILSNLVEAEIQKSMDEAEEDNIPAPSRKECVLRIKTQFETAIDDGYTAEDILADELDLEECCAYCWYGFGSDIPNYINDIYRRLGLSSQMTDKVSRHEDFVVGVIVNAVSLHILNYFLRRLEEESKRETPFE